MPRMGQSTKKGAKKAAEAAAEPPAPDPRLEVLAGYPLHLWIADYTTRKGGCEADYSIEEWREYLVPKMDEWVARGESPERLTSARNRAERAPPSPVLISDKELSTISEQTEAALFVPLGFGKFKGRTLHAVHVAEEWYLKYVVEEKIYKKSHAANLEAGLKLLGYFDEPAPAPAPPPPSCARPTWGAALAMEEVREILVALKQAPLAAAPGLIDQALAKLAKGMEA